MCKRSRVLNSCENMKKVITYGTYDLLHNGHVKLLERAKSLGDFLIVAISTDEFNELKGKKSYYSFEDRKYMLSAIKYVDLVIEESEWNQKTSDIINNNIDIFVMGDDWDGKFDFLNEYCDVIYLKRTPEISSSKIKNDFEI